MGFEPMIRVLQTLALPLGHVAVLLIASGKIIWLAANGSQRTICCQPIAAPRAGDGIRTHDLLLGKETFYR
jgi:hypothetical protein